MRRSPPSAAHTPSSARPACTSTTEPKSAFLQVACICCPASLPRNCTTAAARLRVEIRRSNEPEGTPYQRVDFLCLDVIQTRHCCVDLCLRCPRVHDEDLRDDSHTASTRRVPWADISSLMIMSARAGLNDQQLCGLTQVRVRFRVRVRLAGRGAHEGVVVLNLLHGRLGRQRELDDGELVELLG